MSSIKDNVYVLAVPMFANGAKEVWVASCCKRLLVSVVQPKRCRTCFSKPIPARFSSLAEVLNYNFNGIESTLSTVLPSVGDQNGCP